MNGKAQWVRLADVFVVGPVMFAGGIAWSEKRPALGLFLAVLGVMTVGYNGLNYLKIEQGK